MAAFGSIIVLLIIASFSLLVVRFGATALTMTGLSRDASSFQSLSAFFGVGFTTLEAEMVVSHPVRRRIIGHLILAGNIGITSAVATVVVTFVSRDDAQTSSAIQKVSVLAGGLVCLWLLSRIKVLKRALEWIIKITLERTGAVRAMDYDLLLRVEAGYCISELEIDPGHWLIGVTLGQIKLRTHGVLVLGISRDDGGYVGIPTGTTEVLCGDVLTMYGREQDARALADSPEEPPKSLHLNDQLDQKQEPGR